MPLNIHRQDLSRGLYDLAVVLSHSAKELIHLAIRLSDAGNKADAETVLRIGLVIQAGEGKLDGYAEEVKSSLITRTERG